MWSLQLQDSTGKVGYSYLGIRELASALPIFLDTFPMLEAKLNERRAFTIFTHVISIYNQNNLTTIFSSISLILLVALDYFFYATSKISRYTTHKPRHLKENCGHRTILHLSSKFSNQELALKIGFSCITGFFFKLTVLKGFFKIHWHI